MQSPEGRFIQKLSTICSEDGAFAVPPPLSFRTGPQTGEKSRGTTGNLHGIPRCARDDRKNQKEGGLRGEHGSRPEIAPASAGIQTSAEVCAIGGIPRCARDDRRKPPGARGYGIPVRERPRPFVLRADDGRRSPAARRRGFPGVEKSLAEFSGSVSSSCQKS